MKRSKKSKRTLGSSTATHHSEMLSNVLGAGNELNRADQTKDCERSGEHLFAATEMLGRALAHATSGVPDTQRKALHALDARVTRTVDRYLKACTLGRK